MIEHIFRIEDVKPGVPKVYQFPTNSKVTINDFQLKKGPGCTSRGYKTKRFTKYNFCNTIQQVYRDWDSSIQ